MLQRGDTEPEPESLLSADFTQSSTSALWCSSVLLVLFSLVLRLPLWLSPEVTHRRAGETLPEETRVVLGDAELLDVLSLSCSVLSSEATRRFRSLCSRRNMLVWPGLTGSLLCCQFAYMRNKLPKLGSEDRLWLLNQTAAGVHVQQKAKLSHLHCESNLKPETSLSASLTVSCCGDDGGGGADDDFFFRVCVEKEQGDCGGCGPSGIRRDTPSSSGRFSSRRRDSRTPRWTSRKHWRTPPERGVSAGGKRV